MYIAAKASQFIHDMATVALACAVNENENETEFVRGRPPRPRRAL